MSDTVSLTVNVDRATLVELLLSEPSMATRMKICQKLGEIYTRNSEMSFTPAEVKCIGELVANLVMIMNKQVISRAHRRLYGFYILSIYWLNTEFPDCLR